MRKKDTQKTSLCNHKHLENGFIPGVVFGVCLAGLTALGRKHRKVRREIIEAENSVNMGASKESTKGVPKRIMPPSKSPSWKRADQ